MHAAVIPLPLITIAWLFQALSADGTETVGTLPVFQVVEPVPTINVAVGPTLHAAALAQGVDEGAGIQRTVREQDDTVAVGPVAVEE